MSTKNTTLVIVAAVTGLAFTACAALFGGGEPPPPKKPAYQASFAYPASSNPGAKVDVTIGVVAPQFVGDGETYWRENKSNDTVRRMVRALRNSFNSLLMSKGFNASGPYDSVADMTFPEKKGADVVLYAALDIESGYKIDNAREEIEYGVFGSAKVVKCDVHIAPSGSVQLVVNEPMTGEKMWVKRLDVTQPPKLIEATNAVCQGKGITRPIQDAWAQAHELLYKKIMGGLDRYVNSDEFVVLKQQAADLKSRKGY